MHSCDIILGSFVRIAGMYGIYGTELCIALWGEILEIPCCKGLRGLFFSRYRARQVQDFAKEAEEDELLEQLTLNYEDPFTGSKK